MGTDFLVNGVYPIEYFDLAGVDKPKYPNQYWWASKHRYAEYDPAHPDNYLALKKGGHQSYDVLEIDLGRVRQIDYLNFDILKSPINVHIEYDAVSDADGDHSWVPVVPVSTMPFDNKIFYEASAKNAWYNAGFYFTDNAGSIVNTRYLRIKSFRRPDKWPTKRTKPFRWPIIIKNMRVARYITDLNTAIGPLFDTTATAAIKHTLGVVGNQTVEARQRFIMPENYARGGILPDMLGFSFLVGINQAANTLNAPIQPKWNWSLYDVTDSDIGELIHNGSIAQTNSASDRGWMDVVFDRETVPTNPEHVYELRVKSLDTNLSSAICIQTPNKIPGKTLPGTMTFFNDGLNNIVKATDDPTAILAPGDYFQKISGADASPMKVIAITYNIGEAVWDIQIEGIYLGSNEIGVQVSKVYPFYENGVVNPQASMSLRVFGDVADEGRDVLGNQYRYAAIRNRPKSVLDKDSAGWLSAPQPDPRAVESLYFDMRGPDANNNLAAQVVDAIRIAPRTPGVNMHVYYTDQLISSFRAPDRIDEWEAIEWTPVQQLYVLRGNSTYELPSPVRATFMKLEFSNLSPLPFKIPTQPPLPPVNFKRYPTWVESQFYDPAFNGYQRIVEDWFVRNKTTTMKQLLRHLTDPVQEFQYKQNEFLRALALSKVNSKSLSKDLKARGDAKLIPQLAALFDFKDHSLIDPVTKSKIYFATKDMYKSPLTASVDQSSLLGQAVANRYDPDITGIAVEGETNFSSSNRTAVVSTVNDRISEAYSFLSRTPMWFNRRCLHQYRIERAQFNKKAYFVGIKSVEFLRSNNIELRDDAAITDILHDGDNFDTMTWVREPSTRIPSDPNVYVSYQIGDAVITDEALDLRDFSASPLVTAGVAATNINVYSQPSQQGISYYRGEDYDISYSTNEDGDTVTSISRAKTSNRWVVARDPVAGFKFNDGDTVTGIARPSFVFTNTDFGIASGKGVPITTAELHETHDEDVPTGIAVVSSDEAGETFDADTVTGIASISADETYSYTDADTITGIAIPSADDSYDYADADTVTGIAVISGINTKHSLDDGTQGVAGLPPRGVAVPSADDQGSNIDADTVAPTGIADAFDQYTSLDGDTVTAIADVSATETNAWIDADTVTGIAIVDAINAKDSLDDGTQGVPGLPPRGVAAISAIEVAPYADAGTVTGIAAPSAVETDGYFDSATVTGIAVPDSINAKDSLDDGTQGVAGLPPRGVAVPSAVEVGPYVDAATSTGIAVPSAAEAVGGGTDAATSTGHAVPSASETYTPASGTYSAAVLADSPYAYYRMDDASGTTMVDQISPGTQNGTYNGSPTLGISGATTDGNKAVDFGASNTTHDAIIPAVAAMHPSGTVFSFECWFMLDASGVSNEYFFDMGLNDFCGLMSPGSNLSFSKDTAAGSSATLAFASTGVPNDTTTWHHLVMVKNGPLSTDNHIYLDGAEMTYGGRFTPTVTPNTTSQISIAKTLNASSNRFSGKLDEIAFYNTALSATRVLAHFNAR